MKIKTEIINDHPWLHRFSEHVHSQDYIKNEACPGRKTEKIVYVCDRPNCDFEKVVIIEYGDFDK